MKERRVRKKIDGEQRGRKVEGKIKGPARK